MADSEESSRPSRVRENGRNRARENDRNKALLQKIAQLRAKKSILPEDEDECSDEEVDKFAGADGVTEGTADEQKKSCSMERSGNPFWPSLGENDARLFDDSEASTGKSVQTLESESFKSASEGPAITGSPDSINNATDNRQDHAQSAKGPRRRRLRKVQTDSPLKVQSEESSIQIIEQFADNDDDITNALNKHLDSMSLSSKITTKSNKDMKSKAKIISSFLISSDDSDMESTQINGTRKGDGINTVDSSDEDVSCSTRNIQFKVSSVSAKNGNTTKSSVSLVAQKMHAANESTTSKTGCQTSKEESTTKFPMDNVHIRGDDMILKGGGKQFLLNGKISTMLYAHQRQGIEWLWNLHLKCMGGILGDDMGLGKTMQIAAFLAGLFASCLTERVLIIAPKTLIAHWMKELAVVGLRQKIRDYSGSTGNARDFALHHVLQGGGILLATYDVVRHNWKALRGDFHGRDGYGDMSDDIVTWDYMVLDEGHLIKNPSTQRAKSLREIPSAHRIIISGTPIQNNLREMWALYDFCCPELLGDRKEFKAKYENLILQGNDKHASDRQKRIGSAVAQELRERIAPFFLRRLKSEVFPDTGKAERQLANKNDIICWLRLSSHQRQLYSAFLNSETVHKSLEGSALAALTVLKKICDHPLLLTKKATDDIAEGMELLEGANAADLEAMRASVAGLVDSSDDHEEQQRRLSCKIVFLMALLENLLAEGHRTLIFAQTRKMLNIVEEELQEKMYRYCRIDGTTKSADREKIVQEFQHNDHISIFLLTSQVGGLGLTLTGADRVVIVDPAWNPSMDNQSVDRAYRIGQKKDVVVYRLMTCGTIEEKIYRKQVFKGGLMKVATEHKEQVRYFSQQELRELLTIPKTGYDISITQQQLFQEHANQCQVDEKLMEHIKFLEGQGIAGVSHHDLLFTKTAPALAPATQEEIASAWDPRSGMHSRMAASNNYRSRDAHPLYEAPSEKIKTPKSHDTGVSQVNLRIIGLRENIGRLTKTLADQAMISRLPDRGDNIRRRLDELNMELAIAESLRENQNPVLNMIKTPVGSIMDSAKRQTLITNFTVPRRISESNDDGTKVDLGMATLGFEKLQVID